MNHPESLLVFHSNLNFDFKFKRFVNFALTSLECIYNIYINREFCKGYHKKEFSFYSSFVKPDTKVIFILFLQKHTHWFVPSAKARVWRWFLLWRLIKYGN